MTMWEALFASAIASFLVLTGAAITMEKMQDRSSENQI
jgi:hypothetical protein